MTLNLVTELTVQPNQNQECWRKGYVSRSSISWYDESVWHYWPWRVLKKLTSYGVNNLELQWFTDYLFNRFQIVVVGNQTSTSFNVSSGVPQGSILGPLLFLLFLKDFAEQLMKSKCIQYADDTVISFADSDAPTIQKVLNEEVENLKNYFCKNELVLNLKKGKTETMLFGTAKRLSNTDHPTRNEGRTNSSHKLLYVLRKQLGPNTESQREFLQVL